MFEMRPNAEELVAISFMQWMDDQDRIRHDNYRACREYYEGTHDTQLTDRMRKFLSVKMGEEFRDNYMPIVVDVLVERLNVIGFDAGTQGELLWKWWQKARMDQKQIMTHRSAIRDGDSHAIVQFDNKLVLPRIEYEPAYCDGDGVDVHYSDEQRGEIGFAEKRWRIEKGSGAGRVRRINRYYPDRIEKWISEGNNDFRPFEARGDESWPIWWTRRGLPHGEPLGVPVFHFKNMDQGYNFGQSELQNCMSLQNALNKTIIDLLGAADTTAFRIYTMVGDDPTGLEVAPGSWVYTTRPATGDESAAIDYIPGEDLTPMIKLVESFVVEIARTTRTPLSYFQASGNSPAEGTLKQQESGVIARARERMTSFGNTWEDVMYMCRKVWNEFGQGERLDEEQTIECLWADPETRNERDLIETISLKRKNLEIPLEQAWREAGYSDEKVAQMMAMRQGEIDVVSQQRENFLRGVEGWNES
jgi:hypothetical protein